MGKYLNPGNDAFCQLRLCKQAAPVWQVNGCKHADCIL